MKSESVRRILAATLAGIWLGVACRLAMRAVSIASDTRREFSLGGSLEVIAFGALVGAPVAWLVLAARKRWHWIPGSGVLASLVLFAGFAAYPTPSAQSALGATPDEPWMTAIAFAAAFVSYGVVIELLDFRHRIDRKPSVPPR